jgi:hypothetical protein
LQLGLFPTSDDLVRLLAKYDANGDGELDLGEYKDMFLHYTKEDGHTYEMPYWSDVDCCCCRIDCFQWGHFEITFDKKEVTIKGVEGPCGKSKISDKDEISIELAKSKWINCKAGFVDLVVVKGYFYEGLILFLLVVAGQLLLFEDLFGEGFGTASVGEAMPVGVTLLVLWWSIRAQFVLLRRRASCYIFAMGNPTSPWVRCEGERRQVGPEVGPTPAFIPVLPLECVGQLASFGPTERLSRLSTW